MLKLLGALLVGLSCVLLGRWGAGQLRRHCELLAGLQQGLLLLEKEIHFAATPLPEALRQAAAGAGPAAEIFAATAAGLQAGQGWTAAEAWNQALQPFEARLKREEYQEMSAFAAGLGLTDSDNQLKRIELTRAKMAAAEQYAREQYRSQGKVRQSLGWAAGAALILLFL